MEVYQNFYHLFCPNYVNDPHETYREYYFDPNKNKVRYFIT